MRYAGQVFNEPLTRGSFERLLKKVNATQGYRVVAVLTLSPDKAGERGGVGILYERIAATGNSALLDEDGFMGIG